MSTATMGQISSGAGYVRDLADDLVETDILVPTIHCGGCLAKVEGGLKDLAGVEFARANLSTKRVHVRFRPSAQNLEGVLALLKAKGFEGSPFEPAVAAPSSARSRELLVALAVSGFASGNIMLFSVPIWDGGELDAATQGLFHWLSAVIALLGIVIAGRPFFRSAASALKVGSVNMDVPISLAVVLSYGASLYEASRGGELVYFDAGVMLLFFLLIGRYLDERMRGKASEAAQNLMALQAVPATVERSGTQVTIPADQVAVGEEVLVSAGMRVPVDGTVSTGVSAVDAGLVTGESLPAPVKAGDAVYAGTLNIDAPIRVTTTGRGNDTLLGEIVHLMEVAEQGRGRYVQLADQLAQWYAPVVHLLGALTFLGWWWVSGDAYGALMRAVAVLIITCPCALGLAVPVVQVVAAGILMRAGILLKSGDALEKMADIDTIVFDKTGTLTLGEMVLENADEIDEETLFLAASLGATSRHPLAQGVAGACKQSLQMFDSVKDYPGDGLETQFEGVQIRLGRRGFVGAEGAPALGPELWFRKGDAAPVQFRFRDSLRPGARDTLSGLKNDGFQLHMLSGDRTSVVADVATQLGLARFTADARPNDKIEYLEKLKDKGATVMMVGDGLNDAPALRAAHVSLSPASGADVTQSASDAVFQGRSLAAVPYLLRIAKETRKRVRENFALALGYNVIAVPLAVFGYVTPMVAALGMSLSSIVVTLNAVRMRPQHRKKSMT